MAELAAIGSGAAAPAPGSPPSEEGSSSSVHSAPNAAILLAMSLGMLVRLLVTHVVPKSVLKWIPLPYTCAVFLFGMIAASMVHFASLGPVMDASVKLLFGVQPSFILLVLLPPLLFESAGAVDFHIFSRVSGQALLLAFPGVVLSLAFTGLLLHPLFYDYWIKGWGWTESFLLATILSATDPVAVVAALSELGASPKLSSLIEGESLLNDGSAFVFFLMLQELVAGVPKTFGGSVGFFLQLAVGGPLWGLGCAIVLYFLLRFVHNDPVLEVSGILFAVFSVFFIAEDLFHVSGVLAVVVLGLCFAYRVKFAMSPEVQHTHHAVWGLLAYIANTLIFFISGLLIMNRVVDGSHDIGRSFYDWWTLLVLYLALHLVRTVTVIILSPFLTRMGYGLPWKNGTILVWGGLRGAVSLALGLLVELDPRIDPHTSAVINFHVAGIVFLTLMVNGTTTEFVYRTLLKMGKPSKSLQRLALEALASIEHDAERELPHISHEFFIEEMGIEWPYVRRMSPQLDQCKFLSTGMLDIAQPNIHELENEDIFRKKKQAKATLFQGTLLGAITGKWDNVDHTIVDLEAERLVPARNPGGKKTLLQRNKTIQQFQKAGDRNQLMAIFFNAIKAKYYHMFEEGFLSGSAITLLRDAADEAQEAPDDSRDGSGEPKCIRVEWELVNNSLRTLREGRVHKWIEKIPQVGSILEYETVVVHVQTLGAFVHAHESVIQQEIVVGMESFRDDVLLACHRAKSTMSQLLHDSPGFVKLSSTLMMTRLSVRYKRDKVLSAFDQGLLDSGTKNALVEALDLHLSHIQDFVPRAALFRSSEHAVTVQKEVHRQLKAGGATKSEMHFAESQAGINAARGKYKAALPEIVDLPNFAESDSAEYEFVTSEESLEGIVVESSDN